MFCQEADLERGSGGSLRVVGHQDGRGLKANSTGPVSASQLCLLLVSWQGLAARNPQAEEGWGESCIKNVYGDRNMDLGTWLSMIGFPSKLWVRNSWSLQMQYLLGLKVAWTRGLNLCGVEEFSVVSSCHWLWKVRYILGRRPALFIFSLCCLALWLSNCPSPLQVASSHAPQALCSSHCA